MKQIFLGKLCHWLALIILVAVGWYTGQARWHVIYFNWFIVGLLAVASALVALVLCTTQQGEQVTREALPADDD